MWPVLLLHTITSLIILALLIIVVVLYEHCTQHATLGGEASPLPPPLLDKTLYRWDSGTS